MNLFSTWNGSGSSHPHLRKVKLQSFSQHPSCPSLYYYTLQDSTKSILRFFFFNGEVGMVSVIHWNISAKGQTPVWCPPTPTVPYAWPSTMLNLKHTQESFRCWRKKKKKKKPRARNSFWHGLSWQISPAGSGPSLSSSFFLCTFSAVCYL